MMSGEAGIALAGFVGVRARDDAVVDAQEFAFGPGLHLGLAGESGVIEQGLAFDVGVALFVGDAARAF